MSTQNRNSKFNWFRSFMVLLLVGLLLSTGPAFAQTQTQDSDPVAKRLPANDVRSQNPTVDVALLPFTNNIFLPLILLKSPRGIYGSVTENGAPAAGISLELRFYNSASWSTLTTTTTDADGDYSITGMPSLSPGQNYYVSYRNTAGTPGRLWFWGTRYLTAYSSGSEVEIGNFDIADIVLIAPSDGATVALPYTFQWTPRPATPSDTYEFDLYDFTNGDPYFYTDPPLGYVGAYTLNALPAGFNPGVQYVWEMWVYSPDGGYGFSYWLYYVKFSNTGSGLLALQSVLPKHAQPMYDLPPRK